MPHCMPERTATNQLCPPKFLRRIETTTELHYADRSCIGYKCQNAEYYQVDKPFDDHLSEKMPHIEAKFRPAHSNQFDRSWRERPH
jgi:hypothetical protein